MAIIFKVAGAETGDKKQVKLLCLAQVTSITAKVVADLTDEEAALMGYDRKEDYFERIEKHFKIPNAQRLVIKTEFKKVRDLGEYLD